LACSRSKQTELELVLGEPSQEQRHEVVYMDGLPVLRRRPAGSGRVDPWPDPPAALPLQPPGDPGQDRLELRFSIDQDGTLQLQATDLLGQQPLPPLALGRVR
jgi:hypothetical protein